MKTRSARAALALGLLVSLQGCVAALAIPLVAGSALYTRDKIRVRAATPRPTATVRVENAAVQTPALKQSEVIASLATEAPLAAAALSGAVPDDRWQRFVDFALSSARNLENAPLKSALLVGSSSMIEPNRLPCRTGYPAVVIDLDAGKAPFAPERLVAPPAALREGLVRLRDAGVTVLWITDLPAARAGDVSDALKTSGLDPEAGDPLLLVRGPGDRKQVLRQEANNDVCVVAVAGDRQSDFDELFDYLRNPASAAGLYTMIDAGWFLTPTPLAAEAPATDSSPSSAAPAGG